MPTPNDSNLPRGVHIVQDPNAGLIVSTELADLLVSSRNSYDWPESTGASKSQQTILDLETQAGNWIAEIDPAKAHALIQRVSIWGGNNVWAQTDIDLASPAIKKDMMAAIQAIRDPNTLAVGLDRLSELPGLRLIMATKVYRFYCPTVGAAVDRHASYFFNSLDVVDAHEVWRKAVAFKREWANGAHTNSRLAIYNPRYYQRNRDEYINSYLPVVTQIAKSLNRMGVTYTCAATKQSKLWRPADVEMAAYYWWARHGLS
ncbi:MAG: hypothetical protein COT35_08735 [Nitrospirae bacterium CG08_land_8_20_14_0_20_52_24]|nr:MAG: hypothetical protein COT35_08735 [Nitrospirae bacterium CG08_land_8_20_14_0_20_52_24]PIV84949.1 MAG: hypothetical protein COW52_04885 [Nitrospirae bacterium CG17_big_fil_post_rev_8_21_14_2_50_50_9]PIW86035.1 MAG: hypothetical protein COZ95_01390 [Nitrospirae bacterium CG_4_8_14_3_um_filter_50_41]PIX86170.1 MAG: hypothetical protein COZ32_04660 [Nitrospirae bacterium CG_4_10_14_3_um_filter_53_41]